MVKNIKYFTVFILLFVSMSINVKAEEYCVYSTSSGITNSHGTNSLSIRLKIGDNKKVFSYSYDNITDSGANGWIDAAGGAVNDITLNWENNATFISNNKWSSCPKYVHFGYVGSQSERTSYLYFSNSDNSKDVDPNSEIYQNHIPENTSGGVVTSDNACVNTNSWIDEPTKSEKELLKLKEGYCLYAYPENNETNSGDCYTIQIHYVAGDVSKFELKAKSSFGNDVEVETDLANWISNNGCPYFLGVGKASGASSSNKFGIFYSFHKGNHKISDTFYDLTPIHKIKSVGGMEISNIITDKKIKKYDNCGDLIGEDLQKILKNIITLLRIIIPIILNVFGVIDFGSAIFAGDEEKMKKSQKKFITRLIIGVVIFLIPSLLKLILNISHSIWPVIDNSLCGILSD